MQRNAKIILKNSSYTISSKNWIGRLEGLPWVLLSRHFLNKMTRDSDNLEYGLWHFTTHPNSSPTPIRFEFPDGRFCVSSSLMKYGSTEKWVDQDGKQIAYLKVVKNFFQTKDVLVETDLDLSNEENAALIFWIFYKIAKIEHITIIAGIILFLFFLAPLLSILFGFPPQIGK